MVGGCRGYVVGEIKIKAKLSPAEAGTWAELGKRNEKRSITKPTKLRMLGVNAAGIKCKLKSFDKILKKLKPQSWSVQETKLKPNESVECEAAKDFQIFYLCRQDSLGGGLGLGINKDIESTLVREGNDNVEAMVVQIVLENIPVRIIAARSSRERS